ncbi:bacteriochlorophyll 4-vinyl reductase [Prosthecochloris sp. N3]|uniref:Bacteriochlorophyll 4-vinyl reductase n=1 Tax=Prosthecochloris ethylica TaxID=2743976 RepID=A0ABR9XP46_9CHLB|nr:MULTISPECIES: bacteriochlorophyll 4-vinyl reductase [Prosthecochloris]MEC9486471.1 bacteriochlorophyll 4-vinyl reductase [Prosthecochloris sp.]MBF0585829.1 bacteriochlorophyll 4-vinyl reductase [Prosthecochloris ethylica]MBF0635739.1 bacteriochlorophyll 4-vinyl reductase [Prosthecochloris ethylica]NUK47037.1 bacteriochlorophyll 4-vinyl reductase [Prosthecochloris ethylica]RNA65517.1 bacteriochlorophyll 4-vinyl reductase [Prosthecochloris sp. ZM_2]
MSEAAKIGPNSIIQTVAALEAKYGKAETEAILSRTGHQRLIGNLPSEMVEESRFHALVTDLEQDLGEQVMTHILNESGQRTAAYLLSVRIPGLFQKLLKPLPPGLAFRLLLFAISKNAWTFAGSGGFSYTTAKVPNITVRVTFPSIPVVGHFYLGTFTRLLKELVNPETKISASINRSGNSINCSYTCKI